MNTYDTVVLGLGAVGSAALYQLAKRGLSVLGIDQYSPPHSLGSSHGDTRVTRLAIGEGEHYTPLAKRSHAIWRELEAISETTLLTTNGGLVISNESNASAFHGAPFFQTTVAAACQHDIAHELLDSGEIRRRFPQFAVRDDEIAYFEDSAGFVRPEACIRTQLNLAARHGAQIHRNEKVLGFDAGADVVIVKTDASYYAADRLVVAAGPWLPEILNQKYSQHFKVFRQVQYWFDVEDRAPFFTPENLPIFIWDLPDSKGGIYGFPAVDGPKGGLKIATEQYEIATTPDSVSSEVTSEEVSSMYRNFVAPYLRGVSDKCIKVATCLYTMTKDFGFVVDVHPEFDRVIIASPCSGHGFKHSAALGEAICDLVVDGSSHFDLSSFGFARFER